MLFPQGLLSKIFVLHAHAAEQEKKKVAGWFSLNDTQGSRLWGKQMQGPSVSVLKQEYFAFSTMTADVVEPSLQRRLGTALCFLEGVDPQEHRASGHHDQR